MYIVTFVSGESKRTFLANSRAYVEQQARLLWADGLAYTHGHMRSIMGYTYNFQIAMPHVIWD